CSRSFSASRSVGREMLNIWLSSASEGSRSPAFSSSRAISSMTAVRARSPIDFSLRICREEELLTPPLLERLARLFHPDPSTSRQSPHRIDSGGAGGQCRQTSDDRQAGTRDPHMLNFDEARFLRIQSGAVALAGPIDDTIGPLLAAGRQNIFFL